MPGIRPNTKPHYVAKQLLFLLAALVSYCAGSFTCGLAGSLAFTASTFFNGLLQVSGA